jgi:hypothetical protein
MKKMKEKANHNGIRSGKYTKIKVNNMVATINVQTNFTMVFFRNGLALHRTDKQPPN